MSYPLASLTFLAFTGSNWLSYQLTHSSFKLVVVFDLAGLRVWVQITSILLQIQHMKVIEDLEES